jgi:hypothetical protein
VASAAATYESSELAVAFVEELPFTTRFGPIRLARVAAQGDLEVVGPTTASETAATAEALERAGARIVLLDGAFGRRAFASARVADGVVIAAGMSAGRDLPALLARTREALELVRLGPPPPGATVRRLAGALTEDTLRADPPRPGETFVARDFASVFLTRDARLALADRNVGIAVERPARLLAVTANPWAPGRAPLPARDVFDALAAAFPDVALADVAAGLWRVPEEPLPADAR